MTIKELMVLEENGVLVYHHTGSGRGYESRKGNGHVEKYDGKFGKGLLLI